MLLWGDPGIGKSAALYQLATAPCRVVVGLVGDHAGTVPDWARTVRIPATAG